MQNMMILERGHIQTAYGIFGGVVSYDVYDSGELKSVLLSEQNVIVTHAGELTPSFTENERKKYKPSVEFYKSGMIKSVYLETQQEIETPIGQLPAELVTFFESGEVKRVFPVDGKLSGFRSEEDERELNIPLTFDLEFTKFTALLSSICFYASGDIRSITLFPKESIDLETKYGIIHVRHGFSLYESGQLMSCEPAIPSVINTKIGKITALDPDALGISADSNSLNFYENGTLKSLVTISDRISVQTEDERFLSYVPKIIPPLTEEDNERIVGLNISFSADAVCFDDQASYQYDDCGFTVTPFAAGGMTCTPSDCANCSLCKG